MFYICGDDMTTLLKVTVVFSKTQSVIYTGVLDVFVYTEPEKNTGGFVFITYPPNKQYDHKTYSTSYTKPERVFIEVQKEE